MIPDTASNDNNLSWTPTTTALNLSPTPRPNLKHTNSNHTQYQSEYTEIFPTHRISHLSWDILVPKPNLPPSDIFSPVEKFVQDAIDSRDVSASSNSTSHVQNNTSSSSSTLTSTVTSSSTLTTATKKTLAGYKALLDLLKTGVEDDPKLLSQILLAILYHRQGNVLKCIVSDSDRHKFFIHLFFKMNPFTIWITNMNEVVALHSEKTNHHLNRIPSPEQIQEHEPKYQDSVQLVHVYLHFMVTFVSANSTYLSTALVSLWRFLTVLSDLYHKWNQTRNDDMSTPQDKEESHPTKGTTESHHLYQDFPFLDFMIPSRKQDPFPFRMQNTPRKDHREETQHQQQQQQHPPIWTLILQLHATLAKIVHLVPKGKIELSSILCTSFPYKLVQGVRHLSYVQQCLVCITQYNYTAQTKFLQVWVDKCLGMDVEIHITDDGSVMLRQDNDNDNDERKEEKTSAVDHVERGSSMAIVQDSSQQQHKDQTDKQMIVVEGKENLKVEQVNSTSVQNLDMVNEMADKLDSIMLLFFEYISSSCTILSPIVFYQMIIPSFETSILTTHKSKVVQYLFFLLCGLDSDSSILKGRNKDNNIGLQHTQLYRDFSAKIIDILFDPQRDSILRQSSVCYLASFVSRATFVCPETACEAVSALLTFAEVYMEKFPTEASVRSAWRSATGQSSSISNRNNSMSGSMDATRDMVEIHTLFYTVSQAAFYIMCFRGKECIQYHKQAKAYHSKSRQGSTVDGRYEGASSENGIAFAEPANVDVSCRRWSRLCSHPLQPLRYCLESVRGEFLLLADAFHLIKPDLLDRLIVEDRRMATCLGKGDTAPLVKRRPTSIQTAATLEKRRLSGGVGGLGRGSNPLQSFFPFDPYLLRKSSTYIEKYYRHWEGSCIPENEIGNNELTTTEQTTESFTVGDTVPENDDVNYSDEYEDDEDNDDSSSDDDDDDEEEEGEDVDAIAEEAKDTFDEESRLMTLTRQVSNRKYSMKRPRLESMTSNTDMSENEMAIPREEWVQELKRARALSISDECW